MTTEDEVLRIAQETRWEQPLRAIDVLKSFLSDSPRSVRAKLLLASIYADEYGEGVRGAEGLYREVLEIEPGNIAALSGLALLQGYPEVRVTVEERLQLLSKAADLSGEGWAILNLANKTWDLGRSNEALLVFQRLKSHARARSQRHLVDTAENSIQAILRGEPARDIHYEWPEV